ncbi:MAG: ATP-binding cassette domain-containing protein [Thermoleophilaceae bacterium]|nr:ATP-binding cassette domain-containing protein [Thermoleophilaceae bacterium]
MSTVTIDRTGTQPALCFEGFSYAYPGVPAAALDALSLEVASGEFVLVCGDSGSGKSTFLRAVSGLVPHHFGGSASGSAAICGRDLRDHAAGELAACCGTLLQDPETQIVMDSVRGEIAFPLENLGWEQSAIAVAVEETAAALGIESLLGRRTDELSGGELQRVALAAALAARPEVLVLDEPTSQLDPVAADELLATLARLNVDRGTTIILADHRLERVLDVADRVLMFEAGSIVIDADPQDFLAQAAADPGRAHLLPPLAELFDRAGIRPLALNAKAARKRLGPVGGSIGRASHDSTGGDVVLGLNAVGYSYRDAAPTLGGVSFELRAGERAALMGVNGSGKSTLLRIAHGVQRATKGTVDRSGAVALLLQNPNDYLIHERVAEEAPAESLERFGLQDFAERDPRDLSGGERQRLALAIVMQSDPAVLLLDEPTRGMDQSRKRELAELLRQISARGTAVLVATHDAEFAASFAERALLIGSGSVLADAPAADVLGGGWHFSTAVANLLPGSGAITPAQGAELL